MKTSENIGLNIPESEDFVDVGKLAENFEKIDKHMYIVDRMFGKLVKKIEVDCDCTVSSLVIQIGTFVIGRIAADPMGAATVSGLPAPKQCTCVTARSPSETLTTLDFEAGETSFTIYVGYGTGIIEFMYETEE